jgi:hypothetical protein
MFRFLMLLILLIETVSGSAGVGVPSDLIDLIPPNPKFPENLIKCSGNPNEICFSSDYYSDKMPFCGPVLAYDSICAPAMNVYWPEWNLTVKDSVIESQYYRVVNERINREKNFTVDSIRFLNNENCQNSYKTFLCLLNFNNCDHYSKICGIFCEQFYSDCRFDDPVVQCNQDPIVSEMISTDCASSSGVNTIYSIIPYVIPVLMVLVY